MRGLTGVRARPSAPIGPAQRLHSPGSWSGEGLPGFGPDSRRQPVSCQRCRRGSLGLGFVGESIEVGAGYRGNPGDPVVPHMTPDHMSGRGRVVRPSRMTPPRRPSCPRICTRTRRQLSRSSTAGELPSAPALARTTRTQRVDKTPTCPEPFVMAVGSEVAGSEPGGQGAALLTNSRTPPSRLWLAAQPRPCNSRSWTRG